MKNKLQLSFQNLSAVFRRNKDVFRYLVVTGIFAFLVIRFGFYAEILWIALIYNVISFLWNLFELTLDLLDSVLDVPGLSKFRKRLYDNKIARIKERVKESRKHKILYMPYQTGTSTNMPQVLVCRNNHIIQ